MAYTTDTKTYSIPNPEASIPEEAIISTAQDTIKTLEYLVDRLADLESTLYYLNISVGILEPEPKTSNEGTVEQAAEGYFPRVKQLLRQAKYADDRCHELTHLLSREFSQT